MKTFCDLSSNNSSTQSAAAIAATDGVIIKATEGRSYTNPKMAECVQLATANGKMMGFYHYARPETNKAPLPEVLHFIEAVYPYIGKCPMFLDWEGNALRAGQDQKWARQFLDIFYQITGVKMCIYVQESAVSRVGQYVADGDYGLWVAKYSKTQPKYSPWKCKLLWQYTSTPYDMSKMYGDENTWNAYGRRNV